VTDKIDPDQPTLRVTLSGFRDDDAAIRAGLAAIDAGVRAMSPSRAPHGRRPSSTRATRNSKRGLLGQE